MKKDDLKIDGVDFLIVGGGYVGCYTALMLSTLFPHRKTIIFEKKSALLQGSSRAWFGRFHVIGAHFLLNKHIHRCAPWRAASEGA